MDVNSLKGRNYVITGANSGLGKEITRFLFSKGANVMMVCRSKERGEDCLNNLIREFRKSQDTENSAENCEEKSDENSKENSDAIKELRKRLQLRICDVSLESEIRRFVDSEIQNSDNWKTVDCLVCNAGNLDTDRRETREGVEVTFATHVLFGTYLLGRLMAPFLRKSEKSDNSKSDNSKSDNSKS
eukprot:Selendium_serpulae@DN533_c1_g1_i1.p1